MMIPETLQGSLHELVTAFLAENAHVNLSAFRTEELCWTGNVLDSIAALDMPIFQHMRCAPLPTPGLKNMHYGKSEKIQKMGEGLGVRAILDLGTGGGFPLLPLALCRPDFHFVGLDSVQKKIAAVQRIVDTMKIPNVTLVCGRAEELGRDPLHRERYDAVLCRAVDAVSVLLELMAPFAKVGGTLLCWKSMHIEQELKDSLLARAELSCQIQEPFVYDLGGTWGKRQILIFTKRATTKEKYPRGVGIPRKNPLQ